MPYLCAASAASALDVAELLDRCRSISFDNTADAAIRLCCATHLATGMAATTASRLASTAARSGEVALCNMTLRCARRLYRNRQA